MNLQICGGDVSVLWVTASSYQVARLLHHSGVVVRHSCRTFGEELRQQMVALTCLFANKFHCGLAKASCGLQNDWYKGRPRPKLLAVSIPLRNFADSRRKIRRECRRMSIGCCRRIDDRNIQQNTLGPVLN